MRTRNQLSIRLAALLILLALSTNAAAQSGTNASASEAPNQTAADALARMEFMQGDWRIDARIRTSPIAFIEGSGSMHVSMRPDGRTIEAVMDVAFANFKVKGTTTRVFDEGAGRWNIAWLDDNGPDVLGIEGRFANGRFIELDFGKDAYGPYVGRLVISDIANDQFSVRKDQLYDDGTLLKDIWVYEAARAD